ncbi:MAG: ABC transporter ATP-binding protein [Thermodesulfobacteriota bacterium]
MAELILDTVTKNFGTNTVITDFNLNVADGEFVVLVGPSGCGKSTILRMIAGLEPLSGGGIYINGELVNDVPPKDRDIAMVFQNYSLYPHMTVFDNMAFSLKMRKINRQEITERVHSTAATLGLIDLLDSPSRALSGGQQQRVALGRAIVREPQLFLFDEPLSNLDAGLRLDMRAELIRLHKSLAATMIYVTHDQTEAMSMGDRLVVIRDGMIMQIGRPLEIYNKPANLFVAGFIGSPPMNFITCEIVGSQEGIQLSRNDFRLTLITDDFPGLASYAERNRQIIIGLRPEDFIAGKNHDPGSSSLQKIVVGVEYTEPLGSEILATCQLAGLPLTIRLAPDYPVRPGQELELFIRFDVIKMFDSQTGEAL